jgi:serine protease Do
MHAARRRAMLASGLAGALSWVACRPAAADLPDLVAAAKPSVLPVGSFNPTDSPRFGFRGSSFVVGDGTLAITNFHVLPPNHDAEGAPRLVVMASRSADNAQLRGARVLATDRARDLALLKIDGPAMPALALDEPGRVREGQAVALIGFPIGGALGFAPVTHGGLIASITTVALPAANSQQLNAQALNRLREGNFGVYQLDATAYPGNSGGPLIDAASGRVVGVVNMVLVKGSRETALSQPTGITYAIPVAHVHDLLKGR